jgi:microsomal dipeptidase-like Zn-dependent dipeptidase
MKTIELYQQIKEKIKADWMSELKEEALTIKSETIDINNIWTKINEFSPIQGWIQTLDKTGLVNDFNKQNEGDIILSAEMINNLGQSLHIRPANKGQLSITTYLMEGTTFFYTETGHQIKLGKQRGIASYRLYWSQNNTFATQAEFSRLVQVRIEE